MSVNVYNNEEGNGEMVARVKYNSNLDFWDGHNWSCGSAGSHKGLTKRKNGDYVLIHGTDWQGCQDRGEIIDADDALGEIMESGNLDLLEEKRFSELKKLYQGKFENDEVEE